MSPELLKTQKTTACSGKIPASVTNGGGNAVESNASQVKSNIYNKYSVPTKATLYMEANKITVAINRTQWAVIRRGCGNKESKWLSTTLPASVSLLFSFICLIGTATFEKNGQVLWLPLLATVAHGGGAVTLGLLSTYFWLKRRDTKENPIYMSLKKRFDSIFGFGSKE